MRFILLFLALFLCINVSYAEIYAAQDSLSVNESIVDGERSVRSYVLYSSQEAFLDFNRSLNGIRPYLMKIVRNRLP